MDKDTLHKCILLAYPSYTNNLKENMSRNALKIPRTETGSKRPATNHLNFFFYIKYPWRLPT